MNIKFLWENKIHYLMASYIFLFFIFTELILISNFVEYDKKA